ncbi:MAG: hypothetical protein AAGH41_00470 [Pseudomonadota bacterium]
MKTDERRVGRYFEAFVAICALVTSIVAVFLAWDQSRVMRTQQQSEVWPLLQISYSTDYRGETIDYELSIENAGVGPAIIDQYRLFFEGSDASPDLREFVGSFVPSAFTPAGPHTYSDIEGRVMRQGTEVQFMTASWPKTPERQRLFQKRLNAIIDGDVELPIMEVCYCSILEDCWIASTRPEETRAVPTSSCRAF